MADVNKAQGTVDFLRGQIAEAEASLKARRDRAKAEKAAIDANVKEAVRVVATMKSDLATAQAELKAAKAGATDAPPPVHQASADGAAFDATIVTTED